MALNADELGQALYNARQTFNDKTFDELVAIYGDLNGIRLASAKADAMAIVNHFTANAVVLPTTLIAPEHAGPVTGEGTLE